MFKSNFHPASPVVDRIWTSPKSVQIPPIDVLSYTFGNVSRYDNDKPIFLDANSPSNNLSARQAQKVILQLIQGFKESGVADGDCVCLHAFNCIWYPVIWLAIIGSGARVVGSNPRYTRHELTHLFDLTKPKLIIAQAGCILPITEAAASACHKIDPTKIFSLDNNDESPLVHGKPSWRTLLQGDGIEWPTSVTKPSFDNERVAVYGMTSGTTGLPKAAMISHRAIVAQTAVLEDRFSDKPYQPSQLICLPVFHAFASPLALVLPLRLGVPTYFLPKWSLPEYLQAIETYAITDSPVCPPIVGPLTQLPPSDLPRLHSLRCLVSAGAVLPAPVQEKLNNVLPSDAVLTGVWGTSEAGWHTHGDVKEKDYSGSVGRLLPSVQLRIRTEEGQPVVEEGQPGEASIKASTLFSGYLDNPEANTSAFDSDGFYRTGDRVYVQDDLVYYNDRIKETMKVKGWQVSPTELENVLSLHDEIVDAAVVGITRNNILGVPETLPTAYVVRKSGSNGQELTADEVKEFVATRVISYKHITGDVIFVKQIPRSPAGKILRRYLSEAERDLTTVDMQDSADLANVTIKAEHTGWTGYLVGLFRKLTM